MQLPNDPPGGLLAIHFGHQGPQNGALGDTLGPQDPLGDTLGIKMEALGAIGASGQISIV